MKKSLFKGFTLAEVLITLAVIGVVAVLSIGIFMPKIQDKVLAAQEKTAKIKFTKAMEQMALNNKVGPLYSSTEEFVSELQNYLKLAKVCDNDKLSDCFGYETLIDASGEEFALADATDGSVFNMPEDDTNDFTGDTKGIVTIDGIPMVLAWNKKCEILEPGVYQWGNNTNVSTSCVAALMDVNGTKRPDRIGKDLILLNASQFKNAACIKFTVNGQSYKWGCPFAPTPLSRTQCLALVEQGKISKCAAENDEVYSKNFWTNHDGDRWAGTVQTCGGKDKMPNSDDLTALANYLYNRTNLTTSYTDGLTMDTSKLSALNTTLSDFYSSRQTIYFNDNTTFSWNKVVDAFLLRANSEDFNTTHAYTRSFMSTGTSYYSYARYSVDVFGVCKL